MTYEPRYHSYKRPLILGLIAVLVSIITAYFYLESREEEARAAESRKITRALFEEASVEQIIPKRKVELSGHIQLRGAWGGSCDVLCSSILRLPGVKSVTLKFNNRNNRRFTLRKKGQCDAASTEEIKADELAEFGSRYWGFGGSTDRDGEDFAAAVAANRGALSTSWKLRLGREVCVQIDEVEVKPDFILDNTSLQLRPPYKSYEDIKDNFGTVGVQREGVEIFDAGKQIVLRAAYLKTQILANPVRRSFYLVGGTTITDMGFWYVREPLTNFPRDSSVSLSHVLSLHTNIADGLDWQGPIDEATAALRDALKDTSTPAHDPAFAFVPLWVEMVRFGTLSAQDQELLGALIADRRIKQLSDFNDVIDHMRDDANVLIPSLKARQSIEPADSDNQPFLESWLCLLAGECPEPTVKND